MPCNPGIAPHLGIHSAQTKNWVEISWIAMSAASLTLGAIYLIVWAKYRSKLAHLLFFALAVCATALVAFELTMMHAPATATKGKNPWCL